MKAFLWAVIIMAGLVVSLMLGPDRNDPPMIVAGAVLVPGMAISLPISIIFQDLTGESLNHRLGGHGPTIEAWSGVAFWIIFGLWAVQKLVKIRRLELRV